MNERIDHTFPRTRLFGDEKINWLLDYVEYKLGHKLQGQERWNRIYARHFSNKYGMGKGKDLLDIALVPENWWYKRIFSFATLYKRFDEILASAPSNNGSNGSRKTKMTFV